MAFLFLSSFITLASAEMPLMSNGSSTILQRVRGFAPFWPCHADVEQLKVLHWSFSPYARIFIAFLLWCLIVLFRSVLRKTTFQGCTPCKFELPEPVVLQSRFLSVSSNIFHNTQVPLCFHRFHIIDCHHSIYKVLLKYSLTSSLLEFDLVIIVISCSLTDVDWPRSPACLSSTPI